MMTPTERVRNLFRQTKKLGMDFPTDTMIVEMICDIEFDALWNPYQIAVEHDQDLDALQRLWRDLSKKKGSNAKV
jgi:hypothetical protein